MTASTGLRETTFLREQLGSNVVQEFHQRIRQAGADPADYTLLPVHPWQWREHITRAFAGQLRSRELIVLGQDPHAHLAQQSIHTLACQEVPERAYLKLSLSIVNTSTSRVLAPHAVANAPRISDWLRGMVADDHYLRDELRLILLGEVLGVAVDPAPVVEPAQRGHVRPTQFGIDEAVLPEAVQTARRLPDLRLVGFHLHSISNNLSADAHLAMLDAYRRTVTGWERDFALNCEVVNVGGNYADLTEQFDWQSFARGLHRLVERSFPPHWREIDFECGRFLIAACGNYAAEVLDIKRNHGENCVILRGGTHHFRLPVSWQHNHPFTIVPVDRWPLRYPRPEVHGEPVTVVGELCTPKDVLARDVTVPRVRAGDVLLFSHAGPEHTAGISPTMISSPILTRTTCS